MGDGDVVKQVNQMLLKRCRFTIFAYKLVSVNLTHLTMNFDCIMFFSNKKANYGVQLTLGGRSNILTYTLVARRQD